MHRILVALCCILTLGMCQMAQADFTIDLYVQALIAQLGNNSYVVRENAQRTLLKLREVGLVHLLNSHEVKDPETNRRVIRITDQIETELAWPVTQINWKSKEMLASEIYSELAKQARLQVSFVRMDERAIPVVSLNRGKMTFWEALTTAVKSADHSLFASGRPARSSPFSPLVILSCQEKSRVSCNGCACVIVPGALKFCGSPELGSGGLILPIAVALEPNAASSVIYQPRIHCRAVFDTKEVFDTNFRELIFPPLRGEYINPNYKATTTLYEVNELIPLPLGRPKKIASLEINVTLHAIPRFHTREARFVDAPITMSIGADQFFLSRPERLGGVDCRISLTTRGSDKFLQMAPSLDLMSSSGAHLGLQQEKSEDDDDHSVKRTYRFRMWPSELLSNAKVTIPAKVVSKQFHFTFEDIELPR